MISVLLPSRKRLSKLTQCIKSIADNASSHDNFEICLRIHRDDTETIEALPELLKLCTVRVVIGLQHNGYSSLHWFYQEAAAIARGDWVWVMNDDVICRTKGWDDLLPADIPKVILMPERFGNGGSMYERNPCTPFMFVPNKSWVKCGRPDFVDPFDARLWTLLREHGYETRYLPMEVWHDWDIEANERERKTELPVINDLHEQHMENL